MVIRRQCNIINEKTKNNQSKYKIINKNSKRRERQRKQHHIVTCFFVSTYSSSLCCSVCKTPRCRGTYHYWKCECCGQPACCTRPGRVGEGFRSLRPNSPSKHVQSNRINVVYYGVCISPGVRDLPVTSVSKRSEERSDT